MPALAGPITRASEGSQIVVVTHAAGLVTALRSRKPDVNAIELTKEHGAAGSATSELGAEGSATSNMGQTAIVGQGLLDEPSWHWPTRG